MASSYTHPPAPRLPLWGHPRDNDLGHLLRALRLCGTSRTQLISTSHRLAIWTRSLAFQRPNGTLGHFGERSHEHEISVDLIHAGPAVHVHSGQRVGTAYG